MTKNPRTPQGLADKLLRLKDERKELESQAATIKKQEQAIEADLLIVMPKQGVEEIEGRHAIAIYKSVPWPMLEPKGWDKLGPHILQHEALHLVERRVSTSGCRQEWARGFAVPGVSEIEKTSIHVKAK